MSLMGADFETVHEFKAGDTISAEMFNELFEYIKQSNVSLDAESLVGLWKGLVIKNYKTGCSCSWTSSTDQLYIYLNLSITFSSDGDGTYSFVTSNPQPFDSCSQTVTLSSPYEVVNNILILVAKNIYRWVNDKIPNINYMDTLHTQLNENKT